MKKVMVRYKLKPEHVAENERLVRAVYDELRETEPEGIRYATFRLDDGVSFVHVAVVDAEDGGSPLFGLPAFRRFREGLDDRCAEPLVRSELTEIGSFQLETVP
jgi:hypothetical protein